MSLTEILVVLLLILVVVGPEKIPELMRWAGRGMREIRRATNLFRDTMMMEGESPLPDEDALTPGPLDLPDAATPDTEEPTEETKPRGANSSEPGALMRGVELEVPRASDELARVELDPARASDELRARYLSPPHRNLY